MSENKMIFVSVFNDGVLELAENHLISLKKSNITNYISYTTGQKSYDYLKKKGYNIELYLPDKNVQKEMDWCDSDFIDFEKIRINIIKILLAIYEKVFYLDVDIVVLKNLNKLTNNMKNLDLIIQDDINMPCVGCVLLFKTPKTVSLINTLSKINYKTNLQFEFVKRLNNLKVLLLPKEIFPNGLLFFGKDYIPNSISNINILHQTISDREVVSKNRQNNTIHLVHANYMTGSENKIKAFKDFGLWFL